MAKSPGAFRTIREVAEWLETPAHVLRFWESKFRQITPVKRAGGRRYYRPADMLLLGGIKKLLHEDDLSIKEVIRKLRTDGIKSVQALSRPLEGETATTADKPDMVSEETPVVAPTEQTPPPSIGEPIILSDTPDPTLTPSADVPLTADVPTPSPAETQPTPPPETIISAEKPMTTPLDLELPAAMPPAEEAAPVAPKPSIQTLPEDPVAATPDLFATLDTPAQDILETLPEETSQSADDDAPAHTEVEEQPVAQTSVEDTETPVADLTQTIPADEPLDAVTPSGPFEVPPPESVAELGETVEITAETQAEADPIEITPEEAAPAVDAPTVTPVEVPADPLPEDITLAKSPVLSILLETSMTELIAAQPALEVATSRLEALRSRMIAR